MQQELKIVEGRLNTFQNCHWKYFFLFLHLNSVVITQLSKNITVLNFYYDVNITVYIRFTKFWNGIKLHFEACNVYSFIGKNPHKYLKSKYLDHICWWSEIIDLLKFIYPLIKKRSLCMVKETFVLFQKYQVLKLIKHSVVKTIKHIKSCAKQRIPIGCSNNRLTTLRLMKTICG